ncbi:MAG: GTP 3',8-cyclase MoaA [Candidatus Helarchaeota archaeon]
MVVVDKNESTSRKIGCYTDRYNRPIDNLRISITNRCNLNCIYCHREGVNKNSSNEMTVQEITRIVNVSTYFGIKYIKITGGEPLIRKDIFEIIKKIREIPQIENISLVTNGTLLEKMALDLKKAGLDRINISLDTLDPCKFSNITQMSEENHKKILSGVIKAIEVGLTPLKINMVMLKDINVEEFETMYEFTRDHNCILQCIELVPLENGKDQFDKHIDLKEFEKNVKKRANKIIIRRLQKRRKYFLRDGGIIEFVSPFHNSEFCANCTKIRLTSDGKLKPCLLRDDNLIDIITPIRMGASDIKIKELFKEAINLREPFYKEK